jgi:flagellar M-ring protein FliF
MGFLEKLKAVWQNISLVQKAILLAMAITFGLIMYMVMYWAKQPDMTILYHDIAPEDAAKIVDKISAKNVKYQLSNGGKTIYVPKESVYELRLEMAKNGLPTSSQQGYKIFDEEKIGISPFVQNINLKRALQDELAKSIEMIDGVELCRIHIVTAEQTIFAQKDKNTSASVVLKLRPGYKLTGSNIAAITNLVAGSIEGMKAENVTVVDSQGRLLSTAGDEVFSKGASTAQDYKERLEQYLSEKAEHMLTTVLGAGRATVKVSAVVETKSKNLVSEKYDPAGKVVTKEEIKSNSEKEDGTAAAENEKPSGGRLNKDETITTEYKVGKTVESTTETAGDIKSLSVAAFVDLSKEDANAAAPATGTTATETALIMPVAEVEQVIKNALGLKETDSLKVVQVKFHREKQAIIADEPVSIWTKIMPIAKNSSLGILAVCALLMFKILGGAKTKAAAGAIAGGAGQGGGGAGMLAPGAGDPNMLRRQIAFSLQNNPDQVKQVFASWLEEGSRK